MDCSSTIQWITISQIGQIPSLNIATHTAYSLWSYTSAFCFPCSLSAWLDSASKIKINLPNANSVAYESNTHLKFCSQSDVQHVQLITDNLLFNKALESRNPNYENSAVTIRGRHNYMHAVSKWLDNPVGNTCRLLPCTGSYYLLHVKMQEIATREARPIICGNHGLPYTLIGPGRPLIYDNTHRVWRTICSTTEP